jgi:23S rRNA (cytosine1962-C5)-methyltransferase
MDRREPPRRRDAPREAPGPQRRRGVVRVGFDVARQLAAGHPWVFRDSVRTPGLTTGDAVEVVDPEGGFLGRGLYDADGPIAIRLLTRDARRHLDAALLDARVGRAAATRRALLPDADLTAIRVVNGEGDGLSGVTADRYGDFLLVQVFTAAWERLEGALLDALSAAWIPRGVYVQRRYRPVAPGEPRPGAEHARGEVAPIEFEVREGDLRFDVDVTAPVSPGLFPDLREARRRVRSLASGKRVLNCFSYTGAFSVYAAAGGAASVTSLDAAARAHARARKNLEKNGLAPDRHEFLVGDTQKLCGQLASRGRRFDLIVLDPPAFGAAAGKSGRPFSGGREYADLVAAALGVLALAGLLAAASSARRLSPEEFERALADGASLQRSDLRIVERVGQPPDFPALAGLPESSYLKFAICLRL